MRAAVLCLCLLGLAVAEASQGSAVQKVIELLDELKVKVQKDLATEEASFSDYASFCDDEVADKSHAIKTAERQIVNLEATIEDATASIDSLTNEITDLGALISDLQGQVHEATKAREAEHSVFAQGEGELLTSIDEVSRGITTLKEGQSFIQGKSDNSHWAKVTKAVSSVLDAMRLDISSRTKLESFVQSAQKQAQKVADEDDDFTLPPIGQSLVQQAPTPPAFESQGGAILETMEGMEDKAEKTLADLRQKEMTAQHNFDLLRQGLEQQIGHSNDKLATAQGNKAEAEQTKEDANGKNVRTHKSKEADENYRASLKQECQTKAREWEERSRSGAAETAAIAKAREILTEGVTAFAQVASSLRVSRSLDSDVVRDRLGALLKDLSQQHHSFALAQLANAASSDPFVKIRGLVESMIAKLQKEAQEDATHEAFCSEELGKSRKQKELKSSAQAKHKAKMDSSATDIASLEQAVKTLQSEIADIDKGQGEATALRQKQNAEYAQAAADYRGSADAVARAIEALKSYYDGALFLQISSRRQPEFGGARSDSGGTIISVLEMAQEDFTSLLAEAEASESDDKRAYDQLTQENKVARATKGMDIEGKESEVKSLRVKLEHATEDYESTSQELDSVNLYLAKLEPECVSKGMSYAERKAAREAELEGLKSALNILSGDAIALVQSGRRLRVARHA